MRQLLATHIIGLTSSKKNDFMLITAQNHHRQSTTEDHDKRLSRHRK